jgi:hypothetical protein
MNRTIGLLAFVVAMGMGRTAAGRERLAVFFVADADARLADNLAEVAIAKAAETPGRELVGARELRARLAEIVKRGDFAECLAEPDCLSRVGTAAGVERAVIGSVRRDQGAFALTVVLAETRTAAKQRELSRRVPLDLDLLIAAVQKSVGELLEPPKSEERTTGGKVGPNAFDARPNASAPEPQAQPEPIPKMTRIAQESAAAPTNLLAHVEASPPEQPSSHVSYVAYGVAGLAIASFAAAAITGSVATGTPSGNTRADAQRDLERRKDYATAANGLYAVGGVLSAVTIAAFVWRW